MSGVYFDWSKNWNDEEGEWIMDIRCPNEEHHEKYGYDWETKYESTTDLKGNTCEPYQGCPCCEDDSARVDVMWNRIWPLDFDGMVNDGYDESSKKENRQRRIKILDETPCACIENLDTGEWFICLRGAGMDFGPQIAYTFYLAQKWIPNWLLKEIDMQYCKQLLSEKQFKILQRIVGQQILREQREFAQMQSKWSTKNIIKQYTKESEYYTGYYSPKMITEKRILDGVNCLDSISVSPKQKRSKKKEVTN